MAITLSTQLSGHIHNSHTHTTLITKNQQQGSTGLVYGNYIPVYSTDTGLYTTELFGETYTSDELNNMLGQIIQMKDEHTLVFGKEEIHFEDEADLGAILIAKFAQRSLEKE